MGGTILGGHDVPTGLRFPRCARGVAIQEVLVRREMSRPNDFLFLFREVADKILCTGMAQPDSAVGYLDFREDVGGLRSLVVP
jgi:hypothetical protein